MAELYLRCWLVVIWEVERRNSVILCIPHSLFVWVFFCSAVHIWYWKVGESSCQLGDLDHDVSLTEAERVDVATAGKWNWLFLYWSPWVGWGLPKQRHLLAPVCTCKGCNKIIYFLQSTGFSSSSILCKYYWLDFCSFRKLSRAVAYLIFQLCVPGWHEQGDLYWVNSNRVWILLRRRIDSLLDEVQTIQIRGDAFEKDLNVF